MTRLLRAGLAALGSALLAGCALDVVFPTGSPDTGEGPVRHAWTPVAPTAATPMWQGLQEAFLDADGAPCTAHVAAAMAGDAFCFVAAGGELRCAGTVHSRAYGAQFVDAGISDARQVHLSPTADGPGSNTVCVLAAGALTCFGGSNNSGQLGTGETTPNATFRPWGALTDVVGAATGTWDQFCALDGEGEAWCAGNGFGATPVSAGDHRSVVIDVMGAPSFDDPDRWRASAARSECYVTAAGLACSNPGGVPDARTEFGDPGHVVDGGVSDLASGEVCWLEDDGAAWCAVGDLEERVFTDQPVLLLAVDAYTDSRCALHADGSIACQGSNSFGKLGAGDLEALAEDTVVAPVGTVDTRCR